MTEHSPGRRVLLVFLDGLGIGAKDPRRNPLFNARPRFLTSLLGGTLPSLGNRIIESSEAMCVPLDPNLGVRGLPQSGTGQATLYTGINAARIIHQHFGPYLYSTLKPIVEAHSIFAQLKNTGHSHPVALANAFPQRFFDYLEGPRRRIVAGMYAALTAGVRFRDIDDLKNGTAVSTDITAERWKAIGHPDAPVITPYEAGATLARVADAQTFTLFEYFSTDKAGHEMNSAKANHVLGEVDELLRGIYDHVDRTRTLVIVTSDHGNMEEIGIKTHTRHPVPAILFGDWKGFPKDGLVSLSHLVPSIRSFLG
ncbi:MAG: alkaline phosphatase family protein [Bacteroidetes bacterium]|nr:alkaline phosphatase family protein [Bacteroidota bacterium]